MIAGTVLKICFLIYLFFFLKSRAVAIHVHRCRDDRGAWTGRKGAPAHLSSHWASSVITCWGTDGTPLQAWTEDLKYWPKHAHALNVIDFTAATTKISFSSLGRGGFVETKTPDDTKLHFHLLSFTSVAISHVQLALTTSVEGRRVAEATPRQTAVSLTYLSRTPHAFSTHEEV